MMKSVALSGVVYSLVRRELVLSLEISCAENSVMKERPNTVMPGVR